MKRTLIALGVAATVALPVAAQAAPKVYGKLNVTLDRINSDTLDKTTWQLNSNASRFGVKGEDELTSTLSAIYLIEWEVNGVGSKAPFAGSTDLAQRNRFVGLKNQDIGSLKLGRFDTYLKVIGQNIDLFNDQIADNSNVLTGKTRLNNVIGYESPSWSGLTFNFLVQPGEAVAVKGNPNNVNTSFDNGLANAFSTSLGWTNEDLGLTVALGYDKNVMSKWAAYGFASTGAPGVSGTCVPGNPGCVSNYSPADSAATARTDEWRLVGSYNIKPIGLTVSGLFQDAKRSKAYNYTGTAAPIKPEEKGWLLNAAWMFAEGFTGKVQYAHSNTKFNDPAILDIAIKELTLGLDYNFTKNTKVFGFISQLETDNKNNSSTATNGVTDKVKTKLASLGIEHKF